MKYEVERLEELSGRLGLSAYELTVRTRRQDILEKRQMVMWYLAEHDAWGCTRIAAVTGFNHATALHSRKRVNNLLSVGDRLTEELKRRIQDED